MICSSAARIIDGGDAIVFAVESEAGDASARITLAVPRETAYQNAPFRFS